MGNPRRSISLAASGLTCLRCGCTSKYPAGCRRCPSRVAQEIQGQLPVGLPSMLISSLPHSAMSFRHWQYMNYFIRGDEIPDSLVVAGRSRTAKRQGVSGRGGRNAVGHISGVALGGFSCLLSSCSHRAFSLCPPLWRTPQKLPLFSRCALRAYGRPIVIELTNNTRFSVARRCRM
jgi:hypothetical protein